MSKQRRPALSGADRKALEEAGRAWTEANRRGNETAKQEAHRRAEAIRGRYGYSGGDDGTQYLEQKKTVYRPAGAGSQHNAQQAGMSGADRQALEEAGRAWTEANRRGDEAAKQEAHRNAEAIRGRYGYSGGDDGSQYLPGRQETDYEKKLREQLEAAQKQLELEQDLAVKQGVAQLEEAEALADRKYRDQQDQLERDTGRALDNHALYMEARGDRGGIGHAQYGQLQAEALAGRRALGQARTDLSLDTAQKVAQLRAQGQFRKADGLLKLSQEYLGRLNQLQQWQARMELDERKLADQMDRWQQEYGARIGQMMGEYGGAPTLEARKWQQSAAESAGRLTGSYQGRPTLEALKNRESLLARQGMEALKLGIRPSPSQQQAMGYDDGMLEQLLEAYRRKNSDKPKNSGGKGKGEPEETENFRMPEKLKDLDVYQQLYALGSRSEGDAYHYMIRELGAGETRARNVAKYFGEKLEEGDLEAWWDEFSTAPGWEIVNRHGGDSRTGWIQIAGMGRVSRRELPALVRSHTLEERRDLDTGEVYYRKVR